MVGTANAISATLYERLNFNFIRDIVPVAGIARVPEVMLVNPSLPATTVRELIDYAKVNPGKLTMACRSANASRMTAAGQIPSFSDVRSNVRFARKQTRLDDL